MMGGNTAGGFRRVLTALACVVACAGGGGGSGSGGGGAGSGGAGSGGAGSGGAGSGAGAGRPAGTAAGGAATGATGGIGVPTAPGLATDTAGVVRDIPPLRISATFTRSEAVARAIDLSPTTARAGAVVRLARAAERVAYGEYLPSVSVNSSVLRNGTPTLGGSSLAGVIGPTGLGTPGGAGTTGGSDSSGTAAGGFGGTYGSGIASRAPSSAGPTLSRSPGAPTVTQTGGSTPGGSGSGGSGSGRSGSGNPAAIGTTAYMTFVAGYDVFTGGRRSADTRRARAETRAAQAISVSQRFLVVEQVETVFYDVRRGEDLEAVALAQVRRASEDARQAGRRRAVGTGTPADVLQFELLLNNARVAYAQAAIQRRASAYALGRLTGVAGAVEARLDTAIVPRPLRLTDTAIVALALRAAPTLIAARDSASAAVAGVGAARAQYLPTIRLGTSYTMAPSGLALAGARSGWAVALTTSYPLFNGGVREYQVERATAASQLAQVTAADAERQALSEVERRLGNIALTAQQVRLSQTAVQVARESYRVQNVRYGAGVATVLDLSNAEQQLTQAEQQLVNATYDYALARASLNTFLGQEL